MFAVLAFLEGFLFSLSLCFDLGMVNVAIMKTGMERGFKPSFMIGFGSCFGDLFYLSLALLGVSVIFEYAVVKWIMWIVGSVVLFYLTYKMLRETWRAKSLDTDQTVVVERPLFRDWVAGVGLAMASPTVIAWFAFVAGPIIAGSNIKEQGGLAYFIAGFFVAGLAWSFTVAWMSSLSGAFFKKSMVKVLSFLSALLFLYFAIKVFYGGLTDILD
ncbi:LysE family translocator [Cohnella luojiensis]|uniref:Lysine transporter LysE n=1 Tax=Cohnella luojiensis TaxID=652876 RepID=A0A4Y8LXD6_9BACL|nr:LysE family transporter [Cohnella luojiensis]TFE24530.1 lysine transporter LysE [Cohnella luojiensis]